MAEITEIVEDEVCNVYDCTVDDIHAFDANGIYVHSDIAVEEDSPEENRRSASASVRSDAYDAHPALGMNLDEPPSSASSPGSPAHAGRVVSLGKRKSPEIEKVEESLSLPEPTDDFLNNAPSRRRFR